MDVSGVGFEYILPDENVDTVRLENLCRQDQVVTA
jgi:hypothetical protein